jgi:hypothetical protein
MWRIIAWTNEIIVTKNPDCIDGQCIIKEGSLALCLALAMCTAKRRNLKLVNKYGYEYEWR